MQEPNAKVYKALINLYLRNRQKESNPKGVLNTAVSYVKSGYDMAIGKKTDSQIIDICTGIKNRFGDTLSTQQWIEVALSLVDTGNEAQEQKSTLLAYINVIDPESLLCKLLYGILSDIIDRLTEGNDNSRKEFNEHFQKLQADYDNLKLAIFTRREEPNNDVSKLVEKRQELLLQLAYLDRRPLRPAVQEAIDCKLFVSFKTLNDRPGNMPYCMQKGFLKILYKDKFQDDTRISFEEFEINAIKAPDEPVSHLVTTGLFSQPPISQQVERSGSEDSTQEEDLQEAQPVNTDDPRENNFTS